MAPVLVAGHLCLDIIPALTGEVEFIPGRLIEAGPATLSTGGAVSNVGRALHTLGLPVRLVGMVGDDPFGNIVKDLLGDIGGDLTTLPHAPTSYTVVVSMENSDRMFLHAPGCNDLFGAEHIPEAEFEGVSIMHFGYPPLMARMYADGGAELETLLKKAKECVPLVALDLSLPDPAAPSGQADWKAILKRCLPYVDVFLPSVDELMFCLDRPTFEALHGASLGHLPPAMVEALADKALALGPKAVGIKVGERGFLLKTSAKAECLGEGWGNVCLWHPCFQVHVAGTTGSGDATVSGFLFGLAHGMSPLEACRAAVAVGACGVEAPDAVSGIRPWDETVARLEAGWLSLGVTLPPEWKPNGTGFSKLVHPGLV
ncbi:carbohydrate kinase family protein [bacterium]|nr:MAG: carbohydrate kinase family protein [bacterium]